MLKFIKSWIEKRQQYKQQNKRFKKLVEEAVQNKISDNPVIRALILNPTDPYDFAKSLQFENNPFDIVARKNLSKEAIEKIDKIIVEDLKKQYSVENDDLEKQIY